MQSKQDRKCYIEHPEHEKASFNILHKADSRGLTFTFRNKPPQNQFQRNKLSKIKGDQLQLQNETVVTIKIENITEKN